jgi:hypothetical protein
MRTEICLVLDCANAIIFVVPETTLRGLLADRGTMTPANVGGGAISSQQFPGTKQTATFCCKTNDAFDASLIMQFQMG